MGTRDVFCSAAGADIASWGEDEKIVAERWRERDKSPKFTSITCHGRGKRKKVVCVLDERKRDASRLQYSCSEEHDARLDMTKTDGVAFVKAH